MKVLYLRALLCRKLIQYFLLKPTFWGLCITFFFSAATQLAWAQEASDNKAQNDVLSSIPEGGLKIGDTIPEALWHLPLQVVNHPEGKDTITLNDYRGKLIILDFWATWCTACIRQFPKMDSLAKQFRDDLQVILFNNIAATGDSTGRIDVFMESWQKRYTTPFPLMTTVDKGLASDFFPHTYIPHYIWIGQNGVVAAVTSSKVVTPQNIQTLLTDRTISLPIKNDEKRNQVNKK